MMPPSTGRRLAELLPQARYVEIPNARTLVQFDNPEALCRVIRGFVTDHPLPSDPTPRSDSTGPQMGQRPQGGAGNAD
jgi:hypothetical protein